MRRGSRAGEDRRCLWWYLASFLCTLGGLGAVWLVLWAELEPAKLFLTLAMAPGCAAGLYGWGLLCELDALPAGKRPSYYGFLNFLRIRYWPFVYLFSLVILLLM